MKREEYKIALELVKWLRKEHRNLLWKFDLSSDMKVSIGQAVQMKKLVQLRGHPDFNLMETNSKYAGLFLELKKDKSEIYKKDGTWKKDNHVHEQRLYLEVLETKGYRARFVWSLEQAKQEIIDYIKEKRNEKH